MRLYDIGEMFRRVGEMIDEAEGEITPEVGKALADLEGLEEEKVDGIAALIREADADEEMFRKEAELFRAKARQAETKGERLRAFLLGYLESRGKDRISGKRFKVRVNRAGVPSIRWEGEGEIPERYQRVKVEVDGSKVHTAHREGKLPSGFTVSYSKSVVIR